MPHTVPNGDHDYTGAVLARNRSGATLPRGRILAASGLLDDRLSIESASASAAAVGYPLYAAKHEIPNGEDGIIVPWTVIEDFAIQVYDTGPISGLDTDFTETAVTPGEVLEILSDEAGDTGIAVTIFGIEAGTGNPIYETLTTDAVDGTTPVAGTKLFSLVLGVGSASGGNIAAPTGTITVRDASPVDLTTLTSAARRRGFSGSTARCHADPAFTIRADGATTAQILLVGTDTDGDVKLEALTLAGATDVQSEDTDWATTGRLALGAVPAASVTLTYEFDGYADTQDELYVSERTAGRVTANFVATDGTEVPVGIALSNTDVLLAPQMPSAGTIIQIARGYVDNNVQVEVDDHETRLTVAEAALAGSLVKATVAVADAPGGATDAALTLDLVQEDGATVLTSARQVMIKTRAAQYEEGALNANVTFSAATKGTIVASGNGWALVTTNSAGEFDCTVSNASDETVYFFAATAQGGSNVALGCVVLASNVDAAVWSA